MENKEATEGAFFALVTPPLPAVVEPLDLHMSATGPLGIETIEPAQVLEYIDDATTPFHEASANGSIHVLLPQASKVEPTLTRSWMKHLALIEASKFNLSPPKIASSSVPVHQGPSPPNKSSGWKEMDRSPPMAPHPKILFNSSPQPRPIPKDAAQVVPPSAPLSKKVEVKKKTSKKSTDWRKFLVMVHPKSKEGTVKPNKSGSTVYKFQCSICGLGSDYSDRIRSHVSDVHLGVKRYSCDQCEYETNRSDKLYRHKLTHNKTKPFPCDKCSSSFHRSSDLRNHQLIHAEDRPFKCALCDYGCNRQAHLRQHLQRAHSVQPEVVQAVPLRIATEN